MFMMSVPEDLEEVIDILRSKQWLLSAFDVSDDLLYNPANFIFFRKTEGIDYRLILDRNIFDYIVSSYRKPSEESHRAAIALVVFCQISDIHIDASMALHENLKIPGSSLNESLEELDFFYRVDDSPYIETLIQYAIGAKSSYEINSEMQKSKKLDEISDWYDKYEKLKGWDSLYLIMLKIVDIYLSKHKTKVKLRLLLEWMYKEFRFSIVASYYALILFSSKRPKRMMKYKETASLDIRKKQISNMTWDLFVCDYYIKQLKENQQDVEILFATADKALKELVSFFVKSSICENPWNYFREYFSTPNDFQLVETLEKSNHFTGPREFEGKYFKNPYQRYILIDELEIKLGLKRTATNSC